VIPLFFFLFGIVIGSFLNVCISRIPEDISIVFPASRCPCCETPIKPYDNIPVFSWLFLRGKCRNCHLPISPMYPIVEFVTGIFFVLTYHSFGITLPAFKFLVFGCLLIILIVTDIRVRLLPDAVNWFGFGMALAFATRVSPDDPVGDALLQHLVHVMAPGFLSNLGPPSPLFIGFLSVSDVLLGAAFGSLLLWGAATLYRLVRKRDGMGMGDVKMMAMVGAFLGIRDTFLTILLGTLLGSIVGLGFVSFLYVFGWRRGIAERAHRRGLGRVTALRLALASRYQLPLGTFLGIGALLVVFTHHR
jgi:leader peptidase (prepilin peptidase)/N-methyltransferase